MRQFSTIFLLATAATVSAAVPHTFSSGKTAVAQDVNENFVAMDTAIQNRATKAELADKAAAKSLNDTAAAIRKAIPVVNISGKADSVWVAGQLSARAAKVDLDALKAKQVADSGKLAAATNGKQDKLGFVPYKQGDTMDSLKAGGSALSAWGLDPTWSVLAGDKATNPSLGWARNGSAVFAYTTKGYFGLRDDGKGPIYWSGESNSPERPIWHTGNLDASNLPGGPYLPTSGGKITGALQVMSGVNLAGDMTTEGTAIIASGGYTSAHPMLAVGDMQYGISGFGGRTQLYSNSGIIEIFSKPGSADGVYVGKVATEQWVSQYYVKSAGGTITGDLRISGKLTTNPGATPADYVFEPDYKLAPLSEVEAFTKINKHLPEVPSASDMTENGVDLAAMNMLLLKKVEELTLHAIALQKDVEAQKALVAKQDALLAQQKAQFEGRLERLEEALTR
jgi:hypothetical protein